MCGIDPEAVGVQLLAIVRGQSGVQALVAYDALREQGVCLVHFCEAVQSLARKGAVRSSDPAHPIHFGIPPGRILELGLETPPELTLEEARGGSVRDLSEGFRVYPDQLLGRGSFGRVYLGEQVRLKRPVAVKILNLRSLPDDVPRDWFVERFRREPSVIARLNHPHIVQVIDCGEDGSDLWYAMELLRGGTLLDRIRLQGPVPPDEVRSCFLAMAEALGEAFRHGVIHRDVKPGNIFNAGLKLADFGMARLPPSREEEGAPGMPTPRAAMVGTPFYVAPERASFQSGDHRSDIYSLGATMYHAATGRMLFDVETGDRAKWYRCHLQEPPRPLRELVPDFPGELAAVIHRCLAKDPNARFAGFEALADALRATSCF